MSYNWKKHFNAPGQIGLLRRRIRSLHVKASNYNKMGKEHLAEQKRQQIAALRLHVQLLELDKKRVELEKQLSDLGPIPGIEPYVTPVQ